MTDDLTALTYGTAGELARLVTLVVGLAAQTHPEEVRRALASVFDLAAVEEAHRRLTAALQTALEREADIADRQREVIKKLDRLDERIDRMNLWIDHAAKRYKAALQGVK